MPASTFRAWTVGLIWAILIPGVNQFFFFRYPSITITQIVPQVLSFPICKAWAQHVIITIMAGVGATSAYATDIIAVQKVFYNQHAPFGFNWLSIGGICKRFLVAPPSMIWPTNLTSGNRARGGISRGRFFSYVFFGYLLYNFFPSYLFTALSSFSWICWMAPKNAKVNQLFGVTHGLAMGILTFDWGQIAYNGSPLPVPWWAAANFGVTIAFFYWFLLPILYYTNVWYSGYLPLVSSHSFDNTGSTYNVSRVINSDSSFNLQAYQTYSPLFLSASFAIAYGLSFASITATLTHTFLYYRKQIWTQARRSLSEQPDIHARLMSVYKEVPDWWYIAIFVTMFVFGVISIEVWDTEFPVWAFVLALMISFVYTIPIGVIQAITNQQVGLNVITELIIGYALPGRPIAMMLFKTWGYITMVVATVVAGTVQLGVQAWMFSNVEDLCSPDQKDGFICPSTTVFGTASIIWGVIGPQRLFSHGQLYNGLVFFFLAGAVAPLFQWTLHKKFRHGNMPPATPLNYVPWVLVCFAFNYVIRRRYFGWWSKYNCEFCVMKLSGGMCFGWIGCGYAVGLIVIFFALQYPKNGTIALNTIQSWWGNTVYTKTADFAGVAYKTIPDGKTFGPSSW
ncbi:OPT oligopeptide transporter protein-domain-containing protein [Russula vinacea]|nr:OPT oligopeptide transporter protein-domain-containing protein [Russula vinacea]